MRIVRRLRSNFGIGSSRMAIRSQLAWYWRWLLNLLMMGAVAAVVWWLVQNSYRITGFNVDEARQQIGSLTEENARLKRDLDASRTLLIERDWYVLGHWGLDGSKCHHCGYEVPGVFEDRPGHWGRKRQPVAM